MVWLVVSLLRCLLLTLLQPIRLPPIFGVKIVGSPLFSDIRNRRRQLLFNYYKCCNNNNRGVRCASTFLEALRKIRRQLQFNHCKCCNNNNWSVRCAGTFLEALWKIRRQHFPRNLFELVCLEDVPC